MKNKIHSLAKIGKGSVVEEYCLIDQSNIGRNAVIRSHTRIYADNQIGDDFQTGNGVNLRESNKIGHHVSIGTHSVVEHHVNIGNHVRLHSNVFVPEYSILEDNCWLGPNVVLTNAKYPTLPGVKDNLQGVIVKKNAKIGANCTILPGVIIGENSLVGAGSVVTKNVPDNTVVAGNPARFLKSMADIGYQSKSIALSKIPQIDLQAEYQSIKPSIDLVIDDILSRNAFIMGEDLTHFEKNFAQFCGVKHAIGVGSGTAALELTLKALELPLGSEVICPTHTFVATIESIVNNQLHPVLVDIDPQTHNLDPLLVEKKITSKTKAIIAVHMNGFPADIKAFKKIAQKHKLILIEDAAQAHGALYYRHKAGSLADVACFSFFPAKNLGAYGDAGAITTNKTRLAKRLRLLLNHGRSSKYHSVIVGTGQRLDNLQAAILNVKLSHLKSWNARRQQIAARYRQRLSSNPKINLLPLNKNIIPSYYVFTIEAEKRDELKQYLKTNQIETGIYYPLPLHLQKAYRYLGFKTGAFPVSETITKKIISLPMHPFLSNELVDYVCQKIQDFYAQ